MTSSRQVGNVFRRIWTWLPLVVNRRPARRPEDAAAILEHYVAKLPSAQTAIDAVPGWNFSFPPGFSLAEVRWPFYDDERIRWCLEMAGPMAGRTILELGPLEAMHTYLLSQSGAAHIDAVEANALAYVRCLICREILKIANTRFLLGDFVKWLRQPALHYDLVVASGVLYHSSNPIELLDLISKAGDSFFVWTHYFDGEAMPTEDLRRVPFSGRVEHRVFRGTTIALHERSYFKAWRDPKFCGGIQDQHYWMTKPQILDVIRLLGFETTVAQDEPNHVNGPCFSVFAKKMQSAA